jgi:hypothetical protein
MTPLAILASLLTLLCGVWLGRRLARGGITAENALVGRQLVAYAILGGIAALFALIYYADRLSFIPWLPTGLLLYAEEAVWPLVQAMPSFAIGLLVALEWPGRRTVRRLRTMAAGCLVLLAAWGYLEWRSIPVTGLLGEAAIHDGVVMQTTAYTCAPATIATLARATGLDTGMTERAVVGIARTTREGTTTLAEIRAMRLLGMAPRFGRRLTPDSLVAIRRPALLHVDEPVGAATIRHAVALLGVDPRRRTVTLGNPLHGRQLKSFDELRGYWIGEAVFATAPR